MKKFLKKRIIIPILLILICIFGWTAYVNDYYKADASVDAYLTDRDKDISAEEQQKQAIDAVLDMMMPEKE